MQIDKAATAAQLSPQPTDVFQSPDSRGHNDRIVGGVSGEGTGVRVELANTEKRFEKRLIEEISGLREEMVRSDLSVRDELKADIADLRGRIEKSRSDTIKWMFLFWVGQIGAVLGIILAVFK
jgi:hypothetical protein